MKRVRELRKKNKISANELAEKLNITTRHLYDLEAGKGQLGDDRIRFLCQEFNVTSDYLLGLSEDPTPRQQQGKPNFDIALQEKNLGDAISRIVNICAEFRLSKDIMFEMVDKAVEKYGLPGGNGDSVANGQTDDDEGGIAAHGSEYPGSGILGKDGR